ARRRRRHPSSLPAGEKQPRRGRQWPSLSARTTDRWRSPRRDRGILSCVGERGGDDDRGPGATGDAQGTGKRAARAEAGELLRNALVRGPVAMKDIQSEAKEAGLSWATVRRAKERLGIVVERESHGRDGDGRWTWAMPPSARCSSPLQDAHPFEVSTLQESEHLAADQAKARISIAPADDLDIPDFLDRRPARGSGGRP